MPPRALIEPAIARWLSCFRRSLPSSSLWYFSLIFSCIFGIGVRTDSIRPFLSFVSGKHFMINGAKRCNLASASSTSFIVSSICFIASSQASLSGLIQTTSFSSWMSLRIGTFFSSSLISTAIFLSPLLYIGCGSHSRILIEIFIKMIEILISDCQCRFFDRQVFLFH